MRVSGYPHHAFDVIIAMMPPGATRPGNPRVARVLTTSTPSKSVLPPPPPPYSIATSTRWSTLHHGTGDSGRLPASYEVVRVKSKSVLEGVFANRASRSGW